MLLSLAALLGEGTVNSTTAKKLLQRLCEGDFDLSATVERESLGQIRDEAILKKTVLETLEELPRAVSDYKNGKTAAIKSLQGRVMARTQGRADPVMTERLLKRFLRNMR